MALAGAMGACRTALAQFLPDVEAVAVAGLNSGADAAADDGSGFGIAEEE